MGNFYLNFKEFVVIDRPLQNGGIQGEFRRHMPASKNNQMEN